MAVSSHKDRAGGKLPRGPHRLTSEQVASDQRTRLIEAMVQLTHERGYAATTVTEVIERAQVSRKTFYEHFADREALLLAAFDATAPVALAEVRAASERTGGATRQLEALMRRLCSFARHGAGAVALWTIEIAAADPAGLTRREQLVGEYGALIDECLRSEDERLALPPVLARTLAGATHRTIDGYLRMGRTDALKGLAPQLARWVRGYHPVPVDLTSVQSPCSTLPQALAGGRAPGTLTLAPENYEPPRGKESSGFTQHSNRERILDAVARLVAAHGYTALTAQAIAERADISERAFLLHFKSKDEAFAAALEIGHMKGQAIVERARFEAPDWRTGVHRGVGALLEFLACEPCFTRMAFVDAPLAGPKMTRRTHEHAGAYARLLLEGAPQRRRPPRIAPEAIAHGIFELAFHQAAQHKVEGLLHLGPVATYLTLAPFLGASEAAEAAAS
ncbi:MAG TPA: TetR/AcrR family transcriptional regulator [Solirubrobacteraceae bacterium]